MGRYHIKAAGRPRPPPSPSGGPVRRVSAALPSPCSCAAWQPHRRLLGSLDPAAVRDAFGESGMDGEAGPFTDWVTVCQAGRPRCPSLFLASWGYQCSTWDGSACCLQPNGKFCMLLGPWANATAPAGWVGRNTTPVAEEEDERASSEDGTVAVSPAAAPALAPNATSGEPAAGAAPETVRPAGNSTAGEEAHKAPAAAAQAAEEKEQAVGEPARQDEQRPEREPEKDEPKRDLGRSDGRSSASSSSSAAKGSSRGNDWRRATATYFNSYPPCCTDSRADQRECREFSGCQVRREFAGPPCALLPCMALLCCGAHAVHFSLHPLYRSGRATSKVRRARRAKIGCGTTTLSPCSK